jgi:branched-chain amino acid transport system substrate-binding protein
MLPFKRYLLAGAAAMTVLAAASPSRAACELKLGVLGGLSGATAQWGNAIKAAVEFVAKKANDAGGLQVGSERCQISTSVLDTKATAEGAAAAANQLVSQGIKFVLGPVVSPEATGIKPIALRNNMLVFLNSYAKNAIGPQWPLVFHEGPGPSVWADPIVKAAKAKFNIKSVVVVAPNDQGGTDIASVDVDVYKRNGIEASDEYYQRGTANFAAIITRILAKNPDAVDTASSAPSDAGIMVKQLRQAGFKGPIGRLGGAATDEIVRIVGSIEAVGDFYWYENVATADPKVQVVYDDYKRVMGTAAPENTTMILWVAASQVLLDGISKAGTITDTKKVAEALRTLPVDDKYLGKGFWTGKSFFGIKQEIAFPFGIGMIVDGKMLPVQRVEAVDQD